jgi:ligand-binding SRPBCC domain-containing protein
MGKFSLDIILDLSTTKLKEEKCDIKKKIKRIKHISLVRCYLVNYVKMIEVKRHSGIYTLVAKQELPITTSEAWEFLSNPGNLEKITPEHMGFEITSGKISKMYAGQIISYNVGILPGIKSKWVTEITHVKDGEYFVDEQRFGPYKMWHHEHIIEKSASGVVMTDKVSYKVPFGFLGRIAHGLFIKSQLHKIFKYRYNFLEKTFMN